MRSFRERALEIFPAGSNGEYNIPAELLPVIADGAGARVRDAEGREYLDMTMAWGAALVGHAHPEVVEAAITQARRGANFASVNVRAVELAERLRQIVPSLERVRFVASGSEATLLCQRVAQAATGRPKVLKFEGAYHGQHPVGVASLLTAHESHLPQADPSGAGAAWVERDVLVAPFNDLAAAEQTIEAHAHELSAVIVEPLHRCIPPRPGFLERLRNFTARHGIVLIFDEVVTGFRLALGGAQEYYGVTPDLMAYGKALGGGFPIGAFGGRAELMEVVAESRLPGPRYAWSASTGGGNPVCAAAALKTLEVLSTPGTHARLHALGQSLRALMRSVLEARGEIAQVLGDGPLAQVALSARPVASHSDWMSADRSRARALMLSLLRHGVFLNPMGTKLYLSLAHGQKELKFFSDAFDAALAETAAAPGAHD